MKYLVIFATILIPIMGSAQELHQDLKETVPATVLNIIDEREEDIVGTDATAVVQKLKVRILDGERTGDEPIFENDLVLLKEGDRIFVNRLETIEGVEYYQFKDVDRRWGLALLGVLFAGMLFFLAGWHGVRAFLSLLLSIAAILVILVPLLLKGYDPVLTSVLIAGVMLALVLFITHGLNPRSFVAFLGTFGAVAITGVIASAWVGMTHLTGLGSSESIYLNFGTGGKLDFSGLLLGSIIIGILGVLDDVAITQASVVEEIKAANASLGFRELYSRALRVGKNHIASLVNTLALAYIGASLPLVLLFAQAGSDVMLALNQEIVAAELVRILVGSIGLILAVPLTTAIAASWFDCHTPDMPKVAGHFHTHG